MTGTPNQIEWAEQIKPRVGAEFDRVEQALAQIAIRQRAAARANTEATIAILREKRAEVMAKDQAGYFIKDWQELTDQVRQMIREDPRYLSLRANKITTSVRTNQL
jgi:hypothetical protein